MKKNKNRGRCLDIFKEVIGNYFLGIFYFVCIVVLLVSKIRRFKLLMYKDVTATLETSMTILISMMGFSVSIYVFLNTTLQERQNRNSIEKEIITLFQKKKKKELGKGLIFSIIVIGLECIALVFQSSIDKWWSQQTFIIEKIFCLGLIFLCISITLANISRMGLFTLGIVNYEDGLKDLAAKERQKHDDISIHENINKGDFLNLVNNIEVIIERLIQNHIHAKTSNVSDSNFKRAICDGITDAGEISAREDLADKYVEIIKYRNLLLQDEDLKDSHDVGKGDEIKGVMNCLFRLYLKNELLTNVSISNLTIVQADLSKTSFNKSLFRNIYFRGHTELYSTDFSNSTLNNIRFEDANCENINFSDSKLIDVKFNEKTKLHRAVFVRADLSSMKVLGVDDKKGMPIELDYANFDDADLTHLSIFNVSFNFARMQNARFVHSIIGMTDKREYNITFKYSDMTKSNLLKCSIIQCDFQNANLEQAVFTYTKMKESNLNECKLTEANFTQSNVSKCKFDKAYCRNISLKEAYISKSNFEYATLNLADLSGAILQEVSFNDSVCRESLWVRTSISNSQFERCVFTGARFVGDYPDNTVIQSCDFRFANFSDTAITNIEFKNCDFYGADFTNVRLINVKFSDCQNLESVLTVDVWLAEVSYSGKHTSKLKEPENGWRYMLQKTNGQKCFVSKILH